MATLKERMVPLATPIRLFRLLGKSWMLLGFLMCCTSLLLAQEEYLFNFRQLNIQDGLSHREVFDIQQDRQGLIWIATKYGLNRYDGYQFKWWTKEQNQLNSHPIHEILEDKEGLLWLLTNDLTREDVQIKNLDIFDPVKGQVQSFNEYFAAQNPPFHVTDVLKCIQSPQQDLFFYTQHRKLWRYQITSGFEEIPLPESYVPTLVNENTILGKQGLFLVEINYKGQSLKSIRVPVKRILKMVKGVEESYCLFIQNEQNRREVYIVNDEKTKRLPLPLNFTNTRSIGLAYRETDETFWLAGISGIALVDKNGNILQQYDDREEDIIERTVNSLFFDRQGLAWLGTTNGILLAQVKPNLFDRYLYLNPKDSKIEDFYRCRGLYVADQNLFVNTYTGRYRVDLKTKDKEELYCSIGKNRRVPLARFPIIEDEQGYFWTGMDGVIKLGKDGATEIKRISINKNKKNRVWSLHQSSPDHLWVGNNVGLWYVNPLNFDSIAFFNKYNGFPELAEGLVLDFVSDLEENLWVISNLGLYLLDKEKGITARYSSRDSGEYYLPIDDFHHLYQDEEGIYWLATNGGGLIRWDKKNQSYRQFDRTDGFSNNTIYAIYEDGSEHLWMSSDYGILQFNKNNYEVKNYGLQDGLTYYEFNRTSHFQSADGRIFFGSLNGVTAFDPKDFYEHSTPDAPLIVTDYSVFAGFKGGVLENRTATIWADKGIHLKPEERIYRLEVALLDYFNSDQVSFAYMLEGDQKQWKELQGNNITIEGVPGARYTLRVKAKKAGFSYQANELKIPLIRVAPLSTQVGFRVGIVLLASLLVLLFFWRRNRVLQKNKLVLQQEVARRTRKIEEDKSLIEKQAEELLKQDQLKTRFFTNIAHELRTPLTLILGPAEELQKQEYLQKKERKLLSHIHKNTEQLLSKVKKILDLTKSEKNEPALNYSAVFFHKYLKGQLDRFSANAQLKGVELLLENQLDQNLWLHLDDEKVSTILDNLLSNALKYTAKGGTIRLKAKANEDRLLLEVADTGRGIPAEDLPYIFDRFFQTSSPETILEGGTGIGLSLSWQLADNMNGKLWVESEWEKGSHFFIEIPKKEVSEIPQEAINQSFIQERPLAQQEIEHFLPLEEPKHPEKTTTILLVEDNMELQQYLQHVLSPYTLVFAGNGQEGLDWLAAEGNRAQLIISDIMMPVMDGFTFLKRIKSDVNLSLIPVIMLTAKADAEDRLRALRIGVDDYITKPFVNEELLVKTERLLQNAKTRSEVLEEQPINLNQQKWLEDLERLLLDNLSARHFTQEQIAGSMHISKRQLGRKIKKLTGLTTNLYLREIRLHQAREMLENGVFSTISEVSYAVGFEDQHYFSNLYYERFGKKPIAYFSTSEER